MQKESHSPRNKGVQDPRLLPMVAAMIVGPLGLWLWAQRQPQKPHPSTVVVASLLWGGQLAASWLLLPRVTSFKPVLFYALIVSNLMVLSWLLAVLFAPPGEQALEGSYWWGFGLNLLALESLLIVMHSLSQYAGLPVHPPLLYVGLPLSLGIGWALTLRLALTRQRESALTENKRAASALGWILCISTGAIVLVILQVAKIMTRS